MTGLLVLLLVEVVGPPASPPAGAGAQPAGDLELVRQSAWVPPDGDFEAVVDVSRLPDGAAVQAVLHERVSGRIQYERSTTGERLGSELAASPVVALTPEGSVLAGDDGWVVGREPGSSEISLRLSTRDDGPPDRDRLFLDDQGVYPVSITVTGPEGGSLTQLVTHLVRLPEVGDRSPSLGLAVIVPVHTTPALTPDGTRSLDDAQVDQLRVPIEALAAHPDVPAGVLATPETVDALAAGDDPVTPTLLEQLRGSLTGRQVMATTYVAVDVSAWVAAGLDAELADQLSIGEDTLSDVLGVRADRRTWSGGPGLTAPGLAALGELGIDQVVLDETAVTPLDDGFGSALTQSFSLVVGPPGMDGGDVRALTTDTEVQQQVTGTGDPVLDAHRVLADLAVLYFERPALPRGIALVLPSAGVPAAFFDALLSALEQPAVVEAATPDALFAGITEARANGEFAEDGPLLQRGLLPVEAGSLGDYPIRLRAAQDEVAGFESLVGAGNPRTADLDRLVLVSGAASLGAAGRNAYLDEVDGRVADAVAGIAVEDQAVNLTQRRGVIPVALRNDLDTPVTVTVRFASEKLDFPDGDTVVQTLEPGVTPVTIPVEARASGAFPVDVFVTAPDGLALTEERFTVRSTAVSGLGIVLSVLAALFLLVWWIRHFRKVRRARSLVNDGTSPPK